MRCEPCHVPAEVAFATKPELALQLLDQPKPGESLFRRSWLMQAMASPLFCAPWMSARYPMWARWPQILASACSTGWSEPVISQFLLVILGEMTIPRTRVRHLVTQ